MATFIVLTKNVTKRRWALVRDYQFYDFATACLDVAKLKCLNSRFLFSKLDQYEVLVFFFFSHFLKNQNPKDYDPRKTQFFVLQKGGQDLFNPKNFLSFLLPIQLFEEPLMSCAGVPNYLLNYNHKNYIAKEHRCNPRFLSSMKFKEFASLLLK